MDAVDTTGAGDLYAAGFLFGLAKGQDLKTCGHLGSIAAAEVIGHIGAVMGRGHINIANFALGRLDAASAVPNAINAPPVHNHHEKSTWAPPCGARNLWRSSNGFSRPTNVTRRPP